MQGSRVVIGLVAATLAACGSKPKPAKPAKPTKVTPTDTTPAPVETEADREAKRLTMAHGIIPEGGTCLPAALKEPGAPRLELGVVDDKPMICAFDTDKTRMLGPVGCFTLDLTTSAIAYHEPRPIPGYGFPVAISDVAGGGHAARGYALPDAGNGTAHIVWSPDSKMVGVLSGDKIHVFDAATKTQAHEFTIRGDKGVVGEPASLYWVGEAIFVGNADGNLWVFKGADGALTGGIEVLGGKAGQLVSTKGGGFSILNKTTVGIADAGWNTLTMYDADTGKRTKVNRKVPKTTCKPEDVDAFYKGGSVGDAKCSEFMTKNFGYFVGASGILGSKNLLIVLRDGRLGELGVIDPKTLVEQKKLIKLPWCGGDAPPASPGATPLKE